MADTVKFDPGLGNLVIDFNEFINNFYSKLMSLTTIHQKRTHFKLFASKIEKNLKNNIDFYLGCLLWAYYIKEDNIKSPKEITGNVFYNMNEEQKENYDYMIQVNFIENYFDSFERDMLYYTGKKYKIPEQWKLIVSLYSKFLELNKGFTNTKTTDDIILPDGLKEIKFTKNLPDIKEILQKAIEIKDLSHLSKIGNFSGNA